MYDTFSTEVRNHSGLLSPAGFFQIGKACHKTRLLLFSFWLRKCDLEKEILSKRKEFELIVLKNQRICLHENFLATGL